MSKHEIVRKLLAHEQSGDEVISEATILLEFLLDQMRPTIISMEQQHHWGFKGGWPMEYAIGPSPEEAIKVAIVEVKKVRVGIEKSGVTHWDID